MTGGRAQRGPEQSAAIEKAKHELEHMIDMCPQVMLLVNASGTVLRTNRALLAMLGKSGYADVLGHQLDALFDGTAPQFFRHLMAGAKGVREAETDIVLPNRGTQPMKFSLIGSPDSDVQVLLIEDLSNEKAYEAEQKELHRQQAIQELIGALMHTINQHLTVITVRAKLMTMAIERRDLEPESLKQGLADIMELTLKIAKTMDEVSQPDRRFNSVAYINGMEILDIEPAGPQAGRR